MTEKVAGGIIEMQIPYGERRDEIGALAPSIAVFQQAMHRNIDLNRAVAAEGETRAQRQQRVSSEIARFSGEVEATLAELGRIAERNI